MSCDKRCTYGGRAGQLHLRHTADCIQPGPPRVCTKYVVFLFERAADPLIAPRSRVKTSF